METTSISFSSEVKAELCALPLGDKAGALAECYGILLYSNTFTTREIRMVTGNRALMQRLPRLFKKAFGLEFDQVTGGEDNKKGIFRITTPEKIRRIFEAFGADGDCTPVLHINLAALEEPGARVAFLRGAFLAGGSVTDPE